MEAKVEQDTAYGSHSAAELPRDTQRVALQLPDHAAHIFVAFH
eukprot:COSAG06_NODE_3105_length_5853_cov_1.967153_2_plen_43_part_00